MNGPQSRTLGFKTYLKGQVPDKQLIGQTPKGPEVRDGSLVDPVVDHLRRHVLRSADKGQPLSLVPGKGIRFLLLLLLIFVFVFALGIPPPALQNRLNIEQDIKGGRPSMAAHLSIFSSLAASYTGEGMIFEVPKSPTLMCPADRRIGEAKND